MRTNVPALRQQDAEEEDHEEDTRADPPVHEVGCGLVKEGLVLLAKAARQPFALPEMRAARCAARNAQGARAERTICSLEVWA